MKEKSLRGGRFRPARTLRSPPVAAALALLVVIGDSNAVPWIIHEDLGYVQTLARQRPEPVEALPLPGAGFVRDATRARHAVVTARRMGATSIVLALSTADVQWNEPPHRIANKARRRYEQALAITARVVVVPCFETGPRCAEVRRALADVIPARDLADVSALEPGDFIDVLHLNASGHAKVARAIEERLR